MSAKKIDAAIYDKLKAMAVVAGFITVDVMLVELIRVYEDTHPETAEAVAAYLDLLKGFSGDLPVDEGGN